jgi:hypothetical protein
MEIQLDLELTHGGVCFLELGPLRRNQARQLLHGGRELGSHSREELVIGSRSSNGSTAAKKLEPNRLSNPLDFADENGPDFSGSSHVGATTGASIQILDSDDAESALPVRGLSEPEGCRSVLEAHSDRSVLGDDFIGSPFHSPDLLRCDLTRLQVDRGDVPAEVNRQRRMPQEISQHRG